MINKDNKVQWKTLSQDPAILRHFCGHAILSQYSDKPGYYQYTNYYFFHKCKRG